MKLKIRDIIEQSIDTKNKLRIRISETPEDQFLLVCPRIIYKNELSEKVIVKLNLEKHWLEMYPPGVYDIILDSILYAEFTAEFFEVNDALKLTACDTKIYPIDNAS